MVYKFVIYSKYNGSTIEYLRVLKINSRDIKDYTSYNANIIEVIKGGKIENVGVVQGVLKGSNGDLSRYREGITILFKDKDYYIISDRLGNVSRVHYTDIINKRLKITNGKIVATSKKQYISSLKGEYIKLGGFENDRYRNESVYSAGEREARIRGNTEIFRGDCDKEVSTGVRGNTERDRAISVNDGLDSIGYKPNTKSKSFYSMILNAKDKNTNGACVDLYSVSEYSKMNCISFDNGRAGVAVKKDGDIVSVFKNPESSVKGFIKSAILASVKNGGDRCDCYSIGGALPTMYCDCGMIPVCRIKFDNDFAPDGWNFERDGEPDIVFMAYCGDSIENLNDRFKKYKRFEEYADNEIPYIYADEKECAYDKALKYRDKYIKQLKSKDHKIKVNKKGKVGIKELINFVSGDRDGRDTIKHTT